MKYAKFQEKTQKGLSWKIGTPNMNCIINPKVLKNLFRSIKKIKNKQT